MNIINGTCWVLYQLFLVTIVLPVFVISKLFRNNKQRGKKK